MIQGALNQSSDPRPEEQPPQVAPPNSTPVNRSGSLFEPAQQQTTPEVAAQNAAAAAAATGADPQTIAATAELAARVASDRQSLGQQTGWTRAAFRSQYGDNADQEWVRQHEAELARNERLYGSREPGAGTAPLSSAPAGTPAAPDRRIGVASPPSESGPGYPGVSAQPAAAGPTPTARPAAAVVPANALGLGAVGATPAPTTATVAPGTPAPTANPATPAGGWTPLPGQTPRAPSTLPGSAPQPTAGEPGGPPLTNQYPTPPNPQGNLLPQRPGAVNVPTVSAEDAARYEAGGINPATGDIDIQVTPGSTPRAVPNRAVAGGYGPGSSYTGQVTEYTEPVEPIGARSFEGVPEEIGRTGEEPYIAQRGDPVGPSTIHTPEISTTIQQATYSNSPVDALASMALLGKGEVVNSENVRRDSYHIAQGISGLLSGNTEATWAEPYLNDVARLAWSREEAGNGRTSDPRDAPVDYIEHWKDAFYGSDTRVPMVKELDQQMIDYAAARTPAGQPFRWQDAYGPNGDRGLISAQVTAVDCGPNAWATLMRSRGYNVDPREAFKYARNTGYHNGQEFTGPANMVRMLNQESGLQASMSPISPDGKGWDKIDQELAEGRPVILSSPDHYWVIAAKNPQTGQYYAGKTTLGNSPEWLTRGGFRYNSRSADQAIFTQGDVDPNSKAVKALNLTPPASSTRDTRALLSLQTVGGGPQTQTMSAPAERNSGMPRSYVRPLEIKAYQAAVKAGHPDPVEFVEQIRHESADFDPNVVEGRRRSTAGAQGVIQIMPNIAAAAKVDPYNVDQALEYAANRMTKNYQTYNGDSERALAEYNMGAGNLQKYGPRGLQETNQYINIINNLKQKARGVPISDMAPGRDDLMAMTRTPVGVGQRGLSLAERTGGAYAYNGEFQDTQTEPAEAPEIPEPTRPGLMSSKARAEAPGWIEIANPENGVSVGEAPAKDVAARLWANSYRLSNGDATFADVIGGLANGEAGFAGIKDNRGATGIFQMDPAGGWQQLDRYIKENNLPMTRDQAAKNVDVMTDVYVSRLYKSYLKARQAGYVDPEELTVQTAIYQWDKENEPGAAHNAGIDGVPRLQQNYRDGYREFKNGIFRMVPRSEWAIR